MKTQYIFHYGQQQKIHAILCIGANTEAHSFRRHQEQGGLGTQMSTQDWRHGRTNGKTQGKIITRVCDGLVELQHQKASACETSLIMF